MLSNTVVQRYQVSITSTSESHLEVTQHSVTIASGGLVVGSAVSVTLISAQFPSPSAFFVGSVVDATHINIGVGNLGENPLSLGTVVVNVYVIPPTGEQSN